MPFVKRVPPHPQPKYYVEYQAGGFLCYQRVEPATAHNNLLCIIAARCFEVTMPGKVKDRNLTVPGEEAVDGLPKLISPNRIV